MSRASEKERWQRQATREQNQAVRPGRRAPRTCPACQRAFAVDDRDRTERLLANSDSPLVQWLRGMTQPHGDRGSPTILAERFASWLDGARPRRPMAGGPDATAVEAYIAAHPVAIALLEALAVEERAYASVAAELGLAAHTVQKAGRYARASLVAALTLGARPPVADEDEDEDAA